MLTVGLIGIGYWGPNILRVLKTENNIRVKYICDKNESVLQSYKNDFICTNDYKDILNDEEINMVFIITNISTHFNIIIDCINAYKHVFVEKPLCRTINEMDTIYRKCKENNVKIFCDYIFFYSNKIRGLKNMINDNIENILYIEFNRETFGIFSHDNVVYDLLPHDISILKMLFFDCDISINHTDKVYNQGLLIKSVISFSINNINGIINISWLNNNKKRTIKLFCKDKIIEYSDICDYINEFTYHLSVKNTCIEQMMLTTSEVININLEEPLRTSIKTALNMVETNNNDVFETNAKISNCVIECFEKIL
jgi:hypothetical protein